MHFGFWHCFMLLDRPVVSLLEEGGGSSSVGVRRTRSLARFVVAIRPTDRRRNQSKNHHKNACRGEILIRSVPQTTEATFFFASCCEGFALPLFLLRRTRLLLAPLVSRVIKGRHHKYCSEIPVLQITPLLYDETYHSIIVLSFL